MDELQDEIQREEMNLSELLEDLKKEMLAGDGDMNNFVNLQNVLEKVDFSVLDSVDYETSSSASKRRKTSRGSLENNDNHLKEEIKKQIGIVKNALSFIYDIENTNFRKFISQYRRRISALSQFDGNAEISTDFTRKLIEHAQALPLWVDIDGEDPPPLCGSIKAEENHVSNVGDLVAAHVADSWILAEVTAYDPIKKEYTVDDIYEKSATEQILSSNNLIPLPKWRANPDNNPNALFKKSENVLALYPGSTCFYSASVCESPVSPEAPYTLFFKDDKTELFVHQRFVVHNTHHDKS